jgi:hypothetical protein
MRRGQLPWYRVAGRAVLWAVVGHGYKPWLAAVWAAAVVLAFAVVISDWPSMFEAEQRGTTPIVPIAYATETFLPVIDLGQTDEWRPTGWMSWAEWGVILLGWALSTILVAGFTRIVRTE